MKVNLLEPHFLVFAFSIQLVRHLHTGICSNVGTNFRFHSNVVWDLYCQNTVIKLSKYPD